MAGRHKIRRSNKNIPTYERSTYSFKNIGLARIQEGQGAVTYATTFSGIGGWEIGLNACGWDLQWQCECDPWCRTLLNECFGVPIYTDVTTIIEQSPPPVDALIGSPPCQPFSTAGACGGVADARHLYPAFISLVRVLKPRWVLMEQVPNIFSIPGAFGLYIAGLAEIGYDIVWHCIPACAVGANHERDRLWIIAHSQRSERRKESRNGQDRRVGRKLESVPWDRNWKDALCEFRGMDDGTSYGSHRTDSIRNSVVPQIPHLIGQAINQIENPVTLAPTLDQQ